MTIFLIVFGTIIYIGGILAYLDAETIGEVEFHEGGFLNFGYTTCSNREVTVKDVRLSLIWPFVLMMYVVKSSISIFNDCLGFIFLIVGFKYKNTRLHKYIDINLG